MQARTESEILAVNQKKKNSQPAINYYKVCFKNRSIPQLTQQKSYEQVSEMLQRKRTQRGEQLVKKVKNFTHHKVVSEERPLLVENKVVQEIFRQSKAKQVSRPQSRKNSKKALQGIIGSNEAVTKNKIQRAIDNNKDAIANLIQSTPNNHYYQGHYQKMFSKQLKQIEQQKIQSALIVRNIKTLSKISDIGGASGGEYSQLKKSETTVTGGEADHGDYIPHSLNLRNKTLVPNGSLNELAYNEQDAEEQIQAYQVYTRNNMQGSCNNINDYVMETLRDQGSVAIGAPAGLPTIDLSNLPHLPLTQQPYEGPLMGSPQELTSSARGNMYLPDDYLVQEFAVKSFSEIDIDGGSRLAQMNDVLHFKKKGIHAILKNKQSSLKIDTNKFTLQSYGKGLPTYSCYEPLNQPLFPRISAAINDNQNNNNCISPADLLYPQMLSQIAKQHLIHQVYSPNKIKTKADQLKKSILDHQLLDGTWIIEPDRKIRGINEIVVKGQSVPNKLVINGGIKQSPRKKKPQLQSARGGQGLENSHVNMSNNSQRGKRLHGDERESMLKIKERLTHNKSIDYKDQKSFDAGANLLIIDQEPTEPTKQQPPPQKQKTQQQQQQQPQRPQSLQKQPTQNSRITVNGHNQIRQKGGVQSNLNNYKTQTDMKPNKKHNSISEPIKDVALPVKDPLQLPCSQPALQQQTPVITEDLNANDDSNKGQTPVEGGDAAEATAQLVAKNNYSFRPRRPMVNPIEQQRIEQERLIQLKNEAKEKYQQFSLQNKQNNNKLKYIICAGNNSQIVKRCIDLRKDRWEETNDFDTLFNFKWHPISKGIKFQMVNTYGTRQLVNHFENHECFTTKDQMFKNLLQHCESRKLNVFDYVPVTFLLEVDSFNYAFELEKFLTYFTYIEKILSSKPLQLLEKDQELMESVLANINNKYQSHQMYKDEKGPFFAKRRIPSSHFQGHNIWILKATGFNRGRGIHVFNKLEDLKRLITEYTEGINFDNQYNSQVETNKLLKQIPQQQQAQVANSKQTTNNMQQTQMGSFSNVDNVPSYLRSTSFVIQKYVEKPLLLKKRKFDIRVWVLVAQDARCYLFKEGYIRTSCEEYSLSEESITKAEVHLTNNAVQKYAENYGKFEDGNQLSFYDLQSIIDDESHDQSKSTYVRNELIPRMKEQILISLESVRKKLKIMRGSCSFEMFGYDFIIDGDFNPWLIEVNTNPCLEESSQLLCKYMPRMINDMLKITLDGAYPAKKGQLNYEPSTINVFPIEGYQSDENMWEYLLQLEIYNVQNDDKNANAKQTASVNPLKK